MAFGGDVLLLCKHDRFSHQARKIAEAAFGNRVVTCAGTVGDPEPEILGTASPDVLISFLSPWIIKRSALERAGLSINFHPGSVEYPGIGCYNFALYEGAQEFGAVCHHMLPKVDTGKIVMERRFLVHHDDTVETLKLRTMEAMVDMFGEVVAVIEAGENLPAAPTHWTRRPFTHADLSALKVIKSIMPPAEIERRVRATVYPGYPGPVLHHEDGTTFAYPVPDRPPLA